VILLVKALLIVAALVLLLRLKLDLTPAVLLVTLLAVFLFQVSGSVALRAAGAALADDDTWQLLVIVVAVQFMGAVQKSRRMYDRLIDSLNSLVRDRRLVSMVAPAIVGFLPMPGGALFSAPLVEASLEGTRTTPAFKAFINFWFRHDWELIWPLYQGLLLFQAMSRIPMRVIILCQFPFSLLHIATGLAVAFVFFRRHGVARLAPPAGNRGGSLAAFLAGTWPLLAVVVLFFVTPVPLWISILAVTLLLNLVKHVGAREAAGYLFTPTILRSVLLIAAVMVFQGIIQASAAFAALGAMPVSFPLVVLLVFLVSFTVGFLTGVNTAYIAIAFPVLQPLVQPLADPLLPMLYMYVVGFAGILCSPLHLCLVLTNDYFGASLLDVYRYMAVPILLMIAIATGLVLAL
jgi:uncharacterized protein